MKTILKLNTYKEECDYITILKKEKNSLIKNGYIPDIPIVYNNRRHIANSILYKEKLNKISNLWEKEEKILKNKLELLLGRKIIIPKAINFTLYGTGGTYNLKDYSIIVKLNLKEKIVLHIIRHEIVHLLIEPYVQKYKVNHKNKENLVESILAVIYRQK